MNETLLLLAWLVYFFLHSLLASTAIKSFIFRSFLIKTAHIYRIGYNLFAFTGILILFWLQYIIPSTLIFNTGIITNSIAIFLLAIGLYLMIASIKNYDWKSFIGLTPEKNYTLVIAGMNKYVRHPLYSSTMILVTGFFIGQPYFKNMLLMVLMWIYLAIGIIYEERKLVKIYGEAYKAYQKKVKKMIPFIW